MADAQVQVQVNGSNRTAALRQRLQEVVEANRIALNLRQQQRNLEVKVSRGQA
jgi:hypothetical protein